MPAPILLLPCRYVVPLALPAPPVYPRLTGPKAASGAAGAPARQESGTLPRATSVGLRTHAGTSAAAPQAAPTATAPKPPASSGLPQPAGHTAGHTSAPASQTASQAAPQTPSHAAPHAQASPQTPPASTAPSPPQPSGGGSSRAPWDHDLPDPAPRPYTPPRPRPAPRPREPLAPKAAPQAAHDLLIVPQGPTFRAASNGIMALVRFLHTSQLLAVRAQEDLPDGGLVLELAPDAFAHQLFYEGAALTGAPVLIEGWLRTSPAPAATRFGPPTRQSCFALELLGCRFPAISEGMKARMHQILYLRPEQLRVDHDPTRLRHQTPERTLQPIPRCDIYEVDDV